ncbi:MAG: serine/threonine-protein kinase [Actinomycetota bacterium]
MGEIERSTWKFSEGDEIGPDRYALRRLGGGKQYEVYLAWDEDLYALVVAKLVRPHLATEPGALRSLAREAEVVGGLNHPVIVRIFGATLDGERPQLALEFLEGPRLSRLIRKYGKLELDQLLPLALQVCSALHHLARRGVVHLDVKPSNIIMGSPPRLIDFSIARDVGRAREISSPVGTDGYMAPEQCDPGRAEIGSAADVWGLGATLFHAVAGRPPFPRAAGYDRNDRNQRFPQLGRDPERLPTDVPAPLAEAIAACLAPDPSDRPTPAAVADALEPAVAALPTRPVLRRMRPRLR